MADLHAVDLFVVTPSHVALPIPSTLASVERSGSTTCGRVLNVLLALIRWASTPLGSQYASPCVKWDAMARTQWVQEWAWRVDGALSVGGCVRMILLGVLIWSSAMSVSGSVGGPGLLLGLASKMASVRGAERFRFRVGSHRG